MVTVHATEAESVAAFDKLVEDAQNSGWTARQTTVRSSFDTMPKADA